MFRAINPMKTMILSLPIILCLLFTSMFGTILTSVAQEEMPKYGGRLIVAITSDHGEWVNAFNTNRFSGQIAGQIHDSLFIVRTFPDEGPRLIPQLCESYEVSPDGLTLTIHLVDTKWHDGVPFTSEDVKYTIEEVIRPYHPGGKVNFDVIESIECPDSHTAVFHLKYPSNILLYVLDTKNCVIIPKHIYEETPGEAVTKNPHIFGIDEKPIGTGPFMFKEYVKGSHLLLVRNPNYFRKDEYGNQLPYLDEILFRFIPDPSTQVLALEKGEVDMIWWDTPKHEIGRLNELPQLDLQRNTYPDMDVACIEINLQNSILENVKVRSAIYHALDVNNMYAKSIYGLGLLLKGHLATYGEPEIQYTYDPDKVNQLLDEAGYPRKADGNRFSLDLLISNAYSEFLVSGAIIKENLKQVGIDVSIRSLADVTQKELVYDQFQFDLSMSAVAIGPTPASMRKFIHSTQVGKGPYTNCMHYNNSRVDELLDLIDKETVPDKVSEYIGELQSILQTELPFIPLYIRDVCNMYNARKFGGFETPEHQYYIREPYEYVYYTFGSLGPEGTPGADIPVIGLAASIVMSVIALVMASYAVIKKSR